MHAETLMSIPINNKCVVDGDRHVKPFGHKSKSSIFPSKPRTSVGGFRRLVTTGAHIKRHLIVIFAMVVSCTTPFSSAFLLQKATAADTTKNNSTCSDTKEKMVATTQEITTDGGMQQIPQAQSWRYVNYYDRLDKPSSEIFQLQDETIAAPGSESLQKGQFLVRVDYISLLPLARAHLEKAPEVRDTGAEEIGLQRTKLKERAQGDMVVTVIQSNSDTVQKGMQLYLSAFFGLQSYRIMHDDGRDFKPVMGYPIPPLAFLLPRGVKPADYLAVLTPGSGITAWMALEKGAMATEIANSEQGWAGKKVLVTSAAGGVGFILVQLLLLKGCRVTGITSTVEKAQRLKDETGMHHAIAYKETENWSDELAKFGPFDLFFDHVGGEMLNVGIRNMAIRGQIMLLGAISEHGNYNTGKKITGLQEYLQFPAKELSMRGFMLTNHIGEKGANLRAATEDLRKKIASNHVRAAVTLRKGKFADFPDELDKMVKGDGFGRVILHVVDEEDMKSATSPSDTTGVVSSDNEKTSDKDVELVLNLWNKRLSYYDVGDIDEFMKDMHTDCTLFRGSRGARIGETATIYGFADIKEYVTASRAMMFKKNGGYNHAIMDTTTQVQILPDSGNIRITSEVMCAPVVKDNPMLPQFPATFTGIYSRSTTTNKSGKDGKTEDTSNLPWKLSKSVNWFP